MSQCVSGRYFEGHHKICYALRKLLFPTKKSTFFDNVTLRQILALEHEKKKFWPAVRFELCTPALRHSSDRKSMVKGP